MCRCAGAVGRQGNTAGAAGWGRKARHAAAAGAADGGASAAWSTHHFISLGLPARCDLPPTAVSAAVATPVPALQPGVELGSVGVCSSGGRHHSHNHSTLGLLHQTHDLDTALRTSASGLQMGTQCSPARRPRRSETRSCGALGCWAVSRCRCFARTSTPLRRSRAARSFRTTGASVLACRMLGSSRG